MFLFASDPNVLTIGVVLIHDGTALRNRAQIAALHAATELRTYTPDPLDLSRTYEYAVFTALAGARAHEVRFWQVCLSEAQRPSNITLLQAASHAPLPPNGAVTIYGPQGSTPARRFHWGLTRPLGYAGADVVLHVNDHTLFAVADVASVLTQGDHWTERPWGRAMKRGVLAAILGRGGGVLRENRTLVQLLVDYKQRARDGGLLVREG